MNEEMLRGLASRRSNRAFAPEQITDEELHKVLAAGMNAPTAKNGQSPIIIAVQNPDEVAAVNALNAKFTPNANPYYGAPTILLVLVPLTFPLGRSGRRGSAHEPVQRRIRRRARVLLDQPPRSCLKRTRAAKCSVAGAWRATGAASAPWRSATRRPRPGGKAPQGKLLLYREITKRRQGLN